MFHLKSGAFHLTCYGAIFLGRTILVGRVYVLCFLFVSLSCGVIGGKALQSYSRPSTICSAIHGLRLLGSPLQDLKTLETVADTFSVLPVKG